MSCLMFFVLLYGTIYVKGNMKQYNIDLLASASGGSLKEREKVPLTFFHMKLLNICLIENLPLAKGRWNPQGDEYLYIQGAGVCQGWLC